MTENFDLYNKSGLTNADTDIPSGEYSIPAGITNTSQWNSNQMTEPRVEIAHGLGDRSDKTNQSGVWGQAYYNLCAASAVNTCNTKTDYNTSICPKNWRIPSHTGKGNKSWQNLIYYTYHANNGSDLMNPNHPSYELGLHKIYGYYDWGWTGLQTEYTTESTFWSSTSTTYDNEGVFLYADNYIYIGGMSRFKGIGLSIRCVAR